MYLIPPLPTYSNALLQQVSSLSVPSSLFPSWVNYSCKHTFCKISLLKKWCRTILYTLVVTVLFFYPPMQQNFLKYVGSLSWLCLLPFIRNLFQLHWNCSCPFPNALHIAKAKASSQPSSYLSTESDTVNHFLLFKHIFHLVSQRTPASPTPIKSLKK